MKKIKLKPQALYIVYVGILILLIAAIYYADFSNSKLYQKNENTENEEDNTHVSRLFGDDNTPVVATETVIIRPYSDEKIKIVKNFYDIKAEEKDQENSIINYEQTYIQNNGIAYGGLGGEFDVISALDGTVTKVTQDNLSGNVIEIKYSDRITVIYRSLGKVNIKQNDKVKQGDIIGKSGESNMNKDIGSHVVFLIKLDGKYVNPEEYYEKNVNEI